MVAEKDSVSPAEFLAELKLIYDFPTGKGSVSSGIFRSATIAVDGRAQAASDPYESNKRVKFTDQGSIVVSAEEKIETHDGAMCDPKSPTKYLSTSPHRPKSRGVPPPMWGFHTPAIKTLLPDLVARVGQQKISLLKKINLNQPTIPVSH